ncbi:MAG: hypothetical protein ACHQAY_15515 [Hyphomicrobiales bacterium]
MRLDRRSAVIMSFPRASVTRACAEQGHAGIETGRVMNLAFMAVVLALAALWLVFPPAQLSDSQGSRASLAQDLPARSVLR